MTKKLSRFGEWTVDIRLKEFRRITGGKILFLPFNSYEGDILLRRYLNSLPKDKAIEIAIKALH
jgi:hypothetical protein